MTARAHVTIDYSRFHGVAIYLADQAPDGTTRHAQPVELVMSPIDDTTAATDQIRPALRLPDDTARALLDALAAHYGGTSDTRTLRADYLAERARVDKLIDLVAVKPE